MVVIYHPGYIPGNSSPVASDVVSFLDGDSETCNRLSSRFSENEVDYYEVTRCRNMAEARAYIERNGLRVLGE